MHPVEIQAALKKCGSSQADIARICGVSQPAVSAVVNGRMRSADIERAISEATGIALADLWPQHYGGDDQEGVVTSFVDTQRLSVICHAIEDAVAERFRVKGHCNPRMLGQIYNQVLAKGRSSNDDVKLAKEEVAQFLDSLRALDMPDEQLAKSILRQGGEAPKGISVTGSGNQVAGSSLSGTQINIGTKK
jgi:lambda repressor-like predicted transcriptional regulator